jgi:hypothetical protein
MQEDHVPPPVGIHGDRSNLNDTSERLLGEAVQIPERIEAHDHWVVTPLGREGRSLIIRGRTASFQLACGHLTAGAFVGHRSAARSSLSQSVVFSRLPPCVPLRRTPARLLRLVGLEGVRRPEARRTIRSGRSSRSNCWTRACHRDRPIQKDLSTTRTPTDLIPPSRKRGGRSFGAALSEVAIVTTPTSSAGLATGQAMSRSPIGGSPVPGLAAALWCSRYALRGL